jgi:uncharacterized membrane protein YqjE
MGMNHNQDEGGPAPAAGAGGLMAALQRLGDHGLELLQVRLALLGTELEAEKLRLLTALLRALLALVLVALALGLLSVAMVLLCPDPWRWLAALLLGVVYVGAAYGLWQKAREQMSSPGGLFAASVSELARDRDALRGS